jgi:hypothetical protein
LSTDIGFIKIKLFFLKIMVFIFAHTLYLYNTIAFINFLK